MIELNELQKFQEYNLPLKKVPNNINERLSLVNNSILDGASCIITYHNDINLLRIKLYEGNDSSYSDLKISCTLSNNCKEISTLLTTGNLLASSHGILQLSIIKKNTLHIEMYYPENEVQANRLQQMINAIK